MIEALTEFLRRQRRSRPVALYTITRGEQLQIAEISLEDAAERTVEDLAVEVKTVAEADARATKSQEPYFVWVTHEGQERPTARWPMAFDFSEPKAPTMAASAHQALDIMSRFATEMHQIMYRHTSLAVQTKDARADRLERYEMSLHALLTKSENDRFVEAERARRLMLDDASQIRTALLDEDDRKAKRAAARRMEALWESALKQVDILVPVFASYFMKKQGSQTLAPFLADANLIFSFSRMLRDEQIQKLPGILTPAQMVAIAELGAGNITLELIGPTMAKFAGDITKEQLLKFIGPEGILDRGTWEDDAEGKPTTYKPSRQEECFFQLISRRDQTLLAQAEKLIGTKMIGASSEGSAS